jgi:hypothetical protein
VRVNILGGLDSQLDHVRSILRCEKAFAIEVVCGIAYLGREVRVEAAANGRSSPRNDLSQLCLGEANAEGFCELLDELDECVLFELLPSPLLRDILD